ncbi:hypothetical protein D9758_012273 [Tetrapyrgos nigripes]|uniref:Ricin B lectin domain-containing protein n=1 Tax=Tetrapyrgos nigripes TaxID=182062 RepID=A0A8H5CHJ8_9AGAR|nr:hypothetical protein D9758_012273 [Tetrapyrgos nigripes]
MIKSIFSGLAATLAIVVAFANAQTDPSGDHLLPGKYQIKDWQGRCVDHQPTSSNNFVPVVTMPCKTGKQSQIWNISADVPDLFAAHNYKVLSTVPPVASVTFASAGIPGTGFAFDQQLLLKPDYIDDYEIERWNSTHWWLGDSTGGGMWTSWAVRFDTNKLEAAPMTLVGTGPEMQQLFTFVGPL